MDTTQIQLGYGTPNEVLVHPSTTSSYTLFIFIFIFLGLYQLGFIFDRVEHVKKEKRKREPSFSFLLEN